MPAVSDGAVLAKVVLALVEELRRVALHAAERRAVAAEAAAGRAEHARATDAALADAFADLRDSRLREERHRLRAVDRWLSDRPPRR